MAHFIDHYQSEQKQKVFRELLGGIVDRVTEQAAKANSEGN